jgi:hypothetical protein
MDVDTKLILELMMAFDGVDSSLRKFNMLASPSVWHPIGEKEEAAFRALTAIENRAALKKWYSAGFSINPVADALRKILERAIDEELPLGL